MITDTVRFGDKDYDAKFPWVLEVRGIPASCSEVRWEQFVSGDFRMYFADRSSKAYSAVKTMQKVNPRARQFGPWSDDMLPDMTPGPRGVDAYDDASCRGGVLRPLANARATMRGPSANPSGATYRFEDSPGLPRNFGDQVDGKTFVGITWDVKFEHKLWIDGDAKPILSRIIALTGRYDQRGANTRSVR